MDDNFDLDHVVEWLRHFADQPDSLSTALMAHHKSNGNLKDPAAVRRLAVCARDFHTALNHELAKLPERNK